MLEFFIFSLNMVANFLGSLRIWEVKARLLSCIKRTLVVKNEAGGPNGMGLGVG
jgi:hypothetical protein